jgi:hypothetical protein
MMLLQQLAKTDHQQYEDHYAFTCSAVKTLQEEYAFASDVFLEHAGIKKCIADSGTRKHMSDQRNIFSTFKAVVPGA